MVVVLGRFKCSAAGEEFEAYEIREKRSIRFVPEVAYTAKQRKLRGRTKFRHERSGEIALRGMELLTQTVVCVAVRCFWRQLKTEIECASLS